MNWFKHIFTISLLFIFGLLFFSSCVNDTIQLPNHEEEENTKGDSSSKFYYAAVNLKINGNSTTRTENDIFNDKGLEIERALYLDYDPEEETPHFILVLDETKNKVINVFPLIFDEETEPNEKDSYTYTGYIISYLNDEEFKDYEEFSVDRFLAVINDGTGLYEDIYDNLYGESRRERPLDELNICSDVMDYYFIEVEDKEDKNKIIRYLTMTSSMILDNNNQVIPANYDNNSKIGFHSSPNEAAEDPFIMYVDRMQAKYTVLIEKPGTEKLYCLTNQNLGDIKDETYNYVNSFFISPGGENNTLKYINSYTRSTTIDEKKEITPVEGKWKINVLGWGMNGLEEAEYYFKKIDNSNPLGWAMEYPQRYLWAKDIHYFKTDITSNYPDQSRKVVSYSLVKNEGNGYDLNVTPKVNIKSYLDENQSFSLTYLPFNDLLKKDPIKYISENTFDSNLFDGDDDPFTSRSYLRVGSHLIFACQLLIEGIDNKNLLEYESVNEKTGMAEYYSDRVNTKLLMNDIFWSEDAYKAYVVEYLGYFMLDPKNKAFLGNNDGYIYKNQRGLKADGENFELEAAQIEGGDNKVYIKPKLGRSLYRFDPEKGKYFEIDHEQLVYLAYSHPELMGQCFNQGRMYYTEASVHKPDAPNTGEISTGDFGTVRNNWYNYIVKSINGVGTPVHDPDQPIVPNHEHEGNAIGLGMKLLDWHYLYEDTDLNGQHSRPSN